MQKGSQHNKKEKKATTAHSYHCPPTISHSVGFPPCEEHRNRNCMGGFQCGLIKWRVRICALRRQELHQDRYFVLDGGAKSNAWFVSQWNMLTWGKTLFLIDHFYFYFLKLTLKQQQQKGTAPTAALWYITECILQQTKIPSYYYFCWI